MQAPKNVVVSETPNGLRIEYQGETIWAPVSLAGIGVVGAIIYATLSKMEWDIGSIFLNGFGLFLYLSVMALCLYALFDAHKIIIEVKRPSEAPEVSFRETQKQSQQIEVKHKRIKTTSHFFPADGIKRLRYDEKRPLPGQKGGSSYSIVVTYADEQEVVIVPFLNDSGSAQYIAHYLTQALALKDRDKIPLSIS